MIKGGSNRVLLFVIAVIFILIGYAHFFSSYEKQTQFLALFAGTILLLYNCLLTHKSNQLAEEINKRMFSFSLLKDWQLIDRSIKDQFSLCEKTTKCQCNLGENKPFCHSCNILHNHFEIIALSIEAKFADEGILKDSFQKVFNSWYHTCNLYLKRHGDTENTRISALHEAWGEAKQA